MLFYVRKLFFTFINFFLFFICFRFDLQFSHLLECISVLTTITDLVHKVVMNHTNNIIQKFVIFLQIIGLQVILIKILVV